MKIQKLVTAGAMAGVTALALSGCVQSSSGSQPAAGGDSGDKTLTVFISGGSNVSDLWQNSLGPAFEKDNPGYKVKVTLDLHGEHDQQTMAKMTSAVQQGKDPGFDLVDAGFVSQASAANLLTPVSPSNIAALDGLPKDTVTAGGSGGIPYRGSSVLLAYDTKTVPTPPKTMADVLAWIKANPGKFTYNTPNSGGSGQSFVTSVLDMNVPADVRQKMVTGYEPDLEKYWDEGFKTLASLNPYVYQKGVYPNGNDQVLKMLGSGELAMAPVWSDMFINGQKTGQIPKTVAYTQISEPSLTGGAAYLGIPKTSPRQDAALKLANWVLTPKAQALTVDTLAGYPVISLDKLPPEVQKQFERADTENLRLTYFNPMTKDLNRLWAEKVPGK
ncbi:extracellular solute-binding protein [Arthrobacter sp. B3I4]|uniref:extracellular solute-binding protein n=1 Tax=Arthrobacter sp. B3I4 TaxID=3042267 RepID=UPI002781A2EA|nr:extracellular solute-binding protein [Arthrobacter sp. B3I4]MDQ0757363.1 putative spermidine/putrescine transport system substrate-binding protein [Arthrobacter sp. B3I4]